MRRFGMRWRALALGALVVGLAAVHPVGVRAGSDVVTNCSSDDGSVAGTLRYEVANAAAGDTVTFACSGTITLGGPIDLDQNLTIDGSGQSVTLSGGHTATVPGVAVLGVLGGASVTLKALTIANGYDDSYGGGILNQESTLTVINSTIRDNSVFDGIGAGIEELGGTLTVINSTFSGNSITGDGGCGEMLSCGGLDGGGIAIGDSATVTVTNSTFSGNSDISGTLTVKNSTFNGNSAQYGGGIYNVSATLSVTNSTFNGNSAGGGAGIADYNSPTLANNILAGSTAGGNCDQLDGSSYSDQGGNLSDDASCGFTQSSSKNSATGLNLGSLADNGGPTQTIALGSGSTAIDVAGAHCPSTDQRGDPRPDPFDAGVTTNCDAGAYEFQDPDSDLALTNVPANITTDATSPAGAVVTYTAPTVVDEDSPLPTVSCDHASGATFPIGTTTVTCTATDSDDTPSTVSEQFTVTVEGAAAQLSDLLTLVNSLSIPGGQQASLDTQVQVVQADLAANNTMRACKDLGAFSNHVQAQSGKMLTAAQAKQLQAAAMNIMAVLAC